MDPATIITSLGTYGYPLMFVLMYLEGPIVTFISSFLVSLGFFNLAIVWSLSFLGDFLSDIVHFHIGKKSHAAVMSKLKNKGLASKFITHLQDSMHKNLFLSLVMIKISPPPISSGGLLLVGTLKKKVAIFYSAIISLVLESIAIVLGYFSGSYFQSILKNFNEVYLLLMFFSGLIIIFFLLKQILARISENLILNNKS
jgi:membrane protein DedA with SNARE-associated domain